MADHEYPLFCVDRGVAFDMNQYAGPFDTQAEADERAQKLWAEHCEEYDNREDYPCEFKVRRCRRLDSRDLGLSQLLGSLHELAEEQLSEDPPARSWANWEDEVLQLPNVPAGRRGLAQLIDNHFRARAYLCEPEPKAKAE